MTGRHDAYQSVLVALLQLRKGVRGSFVLLALIVVVALLEQRLAHMPGWSPGHVVNYMPGWQWPCPGRPVQLQHVCVLLTQTSVIISSEYCTRWATHSACIAGANLVVDAITTGAAHVLHLQSASVFIHDMQDLTRDLAWK